MGLNISADDHVAAHKKNNFDLTFNDYYWTWTVLYIEKNVDSVGGPLQGLLKEWTW